MVSQGFAAFGYQSIHMDDCEFDGGYQPIHSDLAPSQCAIHRSMPREREHAPP